MDRRSKLTDAQVDKICERYVTEHVGLRKLAEDYCVTWQTISRVLKKKGVPRRRPGAASGSFEEYDRRK